jgi:hypothetical protein
MRRRALVLLAVGALLLIPSAAGVPDIPGDPTPPVVTPLITGTLGDAGWYRSNVTLNWSVVDPESIILSTSGCDARTLNSDTASTRLTCTAESDGGETTVSKTFKLDKTAPAASANPSRAADANGWYNHELTVGFAGTDATSGLQSCSPPQVYEGPDTPSTTVGGTCRDQAGNTAPTAFPLKYDETAPQASPAARPPDANGWYNHAVAIAFEGSDGTSGVETCTEVTYAGPDDASVALSGICVDRAGNQSASSGFTLAYDETAPQASATASRVADVNGWYNHPLTVSFAGSDATSGLDSCDATKAYSGPDAASVAINGACRDLAGNVSPRSVVVKYDATAPQVSATPERGANANGWYKAPLTVSFAGTDAMSGLASCVGPQSYSGPDSGAAAVAGSCSDQAGNVRNASFPLKYDATAPQANASPGRPSDENGWYNRALAVTFAGTDATSGIGSCDSAKTYTTPDTSSASLSGTCLDRAGNQSAAAAFGFKYDATAPLVTAAPSRQPNANGWYRAPLSVRFTGGDTTSGVQSCEAEKTYGGPDNASTSVGGTCRDQAGNIGNAAFALKYDATAPQASATPSRAANANGWYNAPLSVGFSATDATSGLESCPAAQSYSGPDSGSAPISGVCLDKAGNSAVASVTVKYDATAPATTATPSRQPNANGWYTAPLSVGFSATDSTSTVDTCDAARSYSGPDVGSTTITGTCRDKAGNSDADTFTLKYDATAPQASATPSRQPNANGWYNAPLSVSFAATDAVSGLDACPAAKSYGGPDSAAAVVSGTCLDKAGNGSLASLAVKYDATAPQASATPSRQPNANGWYNAALSVDFAGTDVTSGIDSCDAPKTYSTPDSASASLSGTCLDRAGNRSAGATFGFKYDATAPASSATPSRQPNANGWYRASVSVSFAATDGMSGFDSCDPTKSYSGPDAGSTSVSGNCRDKAGNVGAASFPLRYDATAPQASATPSRSPNGNGWYNAALSVSFTATDGLSGFDSCEAAKSYSGPDVVSIALSGTCLDKAGNTGAASFPVKYDATAPQASATPSRPANANGWHNAPLTVSFAATDATSTVDSCDPAKSYSGPDASSTTINGTCRDKAGNPATASLPLKYDATAPLTTATPGRQPNANGWYKAPIAVSFAATDPISAVDSCDAAKTYSGPDIALTVVTGACRDKAGNSGSGSVTLAYDATAPVANATPSRQSNSAGWYNAPLSVSFSATDATSGLEFCPAAQPYSGPDSTLAVVTATCLDKAGNGAAASLAVKYDETAPGTTGVPSRPADANGWFNRPLAVRFQGSDLTSGIESCTAPKNYAGPDTTDVSMSGTCRDIAGNESGSVAFAFKYDGTAPTITEAISARPPDRGAWYNRPVAFAVRGEDVTAGLDSCPPVTYAGPDAEAASVRASCLDRAGNSAERSFPLAYDGTGPHTTAVPSREPNGSGWYSSPFSVSFAGEDLVSGVESCSSPEPYEGPDSSLAVVGGFCLDRAGNVGLASLSVHFDATAPQVTGATPRRGPDANGWYNHPLVVAFQGTDATSGLEACTEATYAGPDSGAVSVSGSCRDRAGNGSAAASFALRYDATGPTLTGVTAKAGNRTAELTWAASPDTVLVEVRRSDRVVYEGSGNRFKDTQLQNGVRYRYTVIAYDEAHNAAAETVTARPTAPLHTPAAGATVNAPPRLAWAAVDKATHYNVQLWRRGKIFSAWPKGTSIRLRRAWTYGGRRYRLTPGRYRWYVWPGYGRPAAKRYGPLLGSSSFVVRAPRR